MKLTISTLLASATTLYLYSSQAMAAPCGQSPLPACEVPEPSTLPLIIGAAVVAGLVAKFRKK